MAEGINDVLVSPFVENFSCKICLEVLQDPVQCQNNEHYFCRKCITKHLENSETCPLCADQLTLETLRPAPRVVCEVLSQINQPCCSHVSRGCKENVRVEELLSHEQACGYAPVACWNEDCEETVNRRDKERHETGECKFRSITCESCDEEFVYNNYEIHQCTLRKEINDMKLQLNEVTMSLKRVVFAQSEMLEKLQAHDESLRDIHDPLRHFSSATIEREKKLVFGQIFVFGGREVEHNEGTDMSIEVFNWSTRTWTLVKKCLFMKRRFSQAFLYGKRMMVCGGWYSDRIEFFSPNENGFTSCVFPASLPRQGVVNGVLFKNRFITFHEKVEETLLDSPWETRTLLEKNYTGVSRAGVECFGNDIYVAGDSKFQRYDTVRNELRLLPPLPYSVINMATVPYKDSVIIIGGQGDNSTSWLPLNDVLMYNVRTLECERLPSMLERRTGHAAVIVGDVVVVIGGSSKNAEGEITFLKTVEYHVIGESTWQKLPDMNLARHGVTACVYV